MLKAFFLLSVILSTISPENLFSQTADSSTYKASINYINTLYKAAASTQLPIYNGIFQDRYFGKFQGTPYLDTTEWLAGSVIYDSELYENLLLKYDEFRNELIIRHPGDQPLVLQTNRVKQFNLPGHKFVNLQADIPNGPYEQGYYEILYAGNIEVFAKHQKYIHSVVSDIHSNNFLDRTTYFVVTGKKWHEVSGQNSLLKILAGKKRDLQQYLKKNNINFQKDREIAIIALAKLYDSLTHGQ